MTTFVANTNVLELVGLMDEIDETFINSAVVTVTIKDTEGTPVTGQIWPLTMDYVAASDGLYRAFVSESINFIANTRYIAYVEANGGANLVGHFEFHFKALARRIDEVIEE